MKSICLGASDSDVRVIHERNLALSIEMSFSHKKRHLYTLFYK